MLLIAASLAPAAATTTIARPDRIAAELIASNFAPRPGTTTILGIRMTPQPGWHGYWSNPGESGLAQTVNWIAPPGIHFARLQHPAPTLLKSMGLVSYVHSGPHVLVSRMTMSPAIKVGTAIPVAADLNWAACSENQCVPEHARLSLLMVAGDGAKSPDAAALRQALRALPRPASSGTFAQHARDK